MYSFRRRTRDAELSRLRAENAEMRSRIGRLVEEKAVLRDRLEEMSSFKRTPLPLPGTWWSSSKGHCQLEVVLDVMLIT